MPIHQDTPPSAASHRGWKRYAAFGIALLTCPCHLPLFLAVLAGTAFGAWMRQNTLIVLLAMVGIFMGTLFYGFDVFRHRQPDGKSPDTRRDTQTETMVRQVTEGTES